jgi:5-methylcytosine-specific restriction endonuclease McrA
LSQVFILDTNKQPLAPIHPGRARTLLSSGKAAVYRRYPFTIILRHAVDQPMHPPYQPLRIKIDPGSKTTGIAIVNEETGGVVFAAELSHRGEQIKDNLDDRRDVRRSRRNRHTRYRQPRWRNRRRRKGWLPSSLKSRIRNVITWVERFMRLCPITAISQELVRFDLQVLENPEIQGIEYQRGTLFGFEVKEYLLLKWGHVCAYCSKKNVPLQVEHIQPRAKGGSNRISNLTIACEECNQKKGTQDIKEFLKKKPDLLSKILSQAKTPLKDAAAVNATRWALYEQLKALQLPLECGSGGQTKWNRTQRGLSRSHWLDAACVGTSTPETLQIDGVIPLQIKAYGHGCRQMVLMDKFGFPRTSPKEKHPKHGFRTGDHVRSVVPKGARAGTHVGRMSAKANGSFTIVTATGSVSDIRHTYCTRVQRADGYGYIFRKGGSGVSSLA